MNVLVLGAGPAGLAFAIALLQHDPAHRVTVVDRRGPADTPGWGVTLRDNAFGFVLGDGFREGFVMQGRAMWWRGQKIIDLPNPPIGHLVTMARSTFLDALRARAEALGVHFRWTTDIATLPDSVLDEHDLVVAADGASSSFRQRFADAFRPTAFPGENQFAWLGTSCPFPKLSILVRDAGLPSLAWAYSYAEGQSTLIVEVTQRTFEAEGLGRLDADATCARLSALYADELQGHAVRSDAAFRWRRYPNLVNERLFHRNVVLIGDAAHTTHFSQGFGTIFALDDAKALADALAGHGLPDALERYEAQQQPKIAEYGDTCTRSMRWAEAMTAAADTADEAALKALIDARWPDNAVAAGPMGHGGTER